MTKVARACGIMETFRASDVETDNDSDAALVAATKCGEALAFEKLVLRHKRRVLAVAQRITNNREDAEDVMQESFHKAFAHLDSFQEKSQFSTWLTRIAMNESFMLLRRRRGIVEVSAESSEDCVQPLSIALVDQKPGPEESCWLRERNEHLTEAINGLGPKIRKAILLCVVEDRSLEETAQILGTSIGAVKSRLFQGRQKLRGAVNHRLLWGVYAASQTAVQRC